MAEASPISTSTATTTRRPHTKSRAGCNDCRRRRVKCGEEKPKCRQCVRREVPCVYPSAQTVRRGLADAAGTPDRGRTNASGSPQLSAGARGTSASIYPRTATPDRSDNFTLYELRLLHDYTQITSRSLVNDHPSQLWFWQSACPELGFRFPFLLRGLFSLTCLHKAHDLRNNHEDNGFLIAEAASNHNLLIQGFRQECGNVTDENCDVLLASACINIIYVLSVHGWLHDDEESEMVRKSRILGAEWIPLIRGVGAVMHPIHEKVKSGPLGDMTQIEPWMQIDLAEDKCPEDDHLLALRTTWQDSSSSHVYEEALSVLRRCYAFAAKYSPSSPHAVVTSSYYHSPLSGPIIWIVVVQQEYFDLLSQRQPPALLLFAYLGVLFVRLEEYWYFKGWGKEIVRTVEELLGDYWKPYFEWPKRCTQA